MSHPTPVQDKKREEGEEMPPLELGPSRLNVIKTEKKKVWAPSRHMEWVTQRIATCRLTQYPVTAVLHLEFVPDDPETRMPHGWLEESRRVAVSALASPVTVVLDGRYHVAVSVHFVRQNPRSQYFVTTSGWADPFKQAFVAAALGMAEKTLRDNGLPLSISFVLTKPMGSFFIERTQQEQPTFPPTSPSTSPAGEY